jgi:hypothetical protein
MRLTTALLAALVGVHHCSQLGRAGTVGSEPGKAGIGHEEALHVDAAGATHPAAAAYLDSLAAEITATQGLIDAYTRQLAALQSARQAVAAAPALAARLPPLGGAGAAAALAGAQQPRHAAAAAGPVHAAASDSALGGGGAGSVGLYVGLSARTPFAHHFLPRFLVPAAMPPHTAAASRGPARLLGGAADERGEPALVAMTFMPLQRSFGIPATHAASSPAAAAAADTLLPHRPTAILARVFADGSIRLSSGGTEAEVTVVRAAEGVEGEAWAVTHVGYAGADTAPALVLLAAPPPGSTAAARLLLFSVLVCFNGVDIVGRGGAECSGSGRGLRAHLRQAGGGTPLPPTAGAPTALHVYAPRDEVQAQLFVGFASGRLLVFGKDGAPKDEVQPLAEVEGGEVGASGWVGAPHAVGAIARHGSVLAFSRGTRVHVHLLYTSRLQYAAMEAGVEGGSGGGGAAGGRARVVSLAFDAFTSATLWAATAGGDVLAFSVKPVATSGGTSARAAAVAAAPASRPISRVPRLAADLLPPALAPPPGAAGSLPPLQLQSVRGYLLAAGVGGLAVFSSNASGGELLYVQHSMSGAEAAAAAAAGGAAAAATPPLRLAVHGPGSEGRGSSFMVSQKRHSNGRQDDKADLLVAVAGAPAWMDADAEGVVEGAPAAAGRGGSGGVIVFDCLLPFTLEDPWDAAGNWGSWMRTPLIVGAIVLFMAYRSRSSKGSGGGGGGGARGEDSGEGEEEDGSGDSSDWLGAVLKKVGMGASMALRGNVGHALRAQMADGGRGEEEEAEIAAAWQGAAAAMGGGSEDGAWEQRQWQQQQQQQQQQQRRGAQGGGGSVKERAVQAEMERLLAQLSRKDEGNGGGSNAAAGRRIPARRGAGGRGAPLPPAAAAAVEEVEDYESAAVRAAVQAYERSQRIARNPAALRAGLDGGLGGPGGLDGGLDFGGVDMAELVALADGRGGVSARRRAAVRPQPNSPDASDAEAAAEGEEGEEGAGMARARRATPLAGARANKFSYAAGRTDEPLSSSEEEGEEEEGGGGGGGGGGGPGGGRAAAAHLQRGRAAQRTYDSAGRPMAGGAYVYAQEGEAGEGGDSSADD